MKRDLTQGNTVIYVGIIDDHVAIRLGVTALLSKATDTEVTVSASTVDEFFASNPNVDVVLLDLALHDGSTVTENVKRLHRAGLEAIAFTSGDRPHLIREASRAGVAGIVRKSGGFDKVHQAILATATGNVEVDAEWASALESDRAFVESLLSARETEVLALYASGETASRVSQALFISEETVIEHISRIRRKYRLQGRPAASKIDLFRRALEDGVVEL